MTSSQSSSVASTTDASGIDARVGRGNLPAARTPRPRPRSSEPRVLRLRDVRCHDGDIPGRVPKRIAECRRPIDVDGCKGKVHGLPSRANTASPSPRPIPAAAPVTTADLPSNRPEGNWVADFSHSAISSSCASDPRTRVGPASRCDERIQGASRWSITLPAIIVRVSPLQTQVKRAQSLNPQSEGTPLPLRKRPRRAQRMHRRSDRPIASGRLSSSSCFRSRRC